MVFPNYEVRVSEKVIAHIDELIGYIAFDLDMPLAASKRNDEIWMAIWSLKYLPKRNSLIESDISGVRRIHLNGLFIYYIIEEEGNYVDVLLLTSDRVGSLKLSKEIESPVERGI